MLSLLWLTLAAPPAPPFHDTGRAGAPVLVVLAGTDQAQAAFEIWKARGEARGWRVIVPMGMPPPWSDSGAAALEAVLEEAARKAPYDRGRVYLAGAAESAAGVFYARSRLPHLWAAALAIEGSPRPAIDTNRLFSANTQLVPLLWCSSHSRKPEFGTLEFHWRAASQTSIEQALDFLAAHQQEARPVKVDCETGSPRFNRCYWLRIRRFDPAARNDALPLSRVDPGSGAFLGLGGFGYDASLPGPGLVVGWLPENYKGPLRLQDRIVALGGKPIGEPKDYIQLMNAVREEKPVVVTVQRDKQRLRLETRILLPKREELVTARVQAEWLPEGGEVLLITRGVAELEADFPAACKANWNGQRMFKIEAPGCRRLSLASDTAEPCAK